MARLAGRAILRALQIISEARLNIAIAGGILQAKHLYGNSVAAWVDIGAFAAKDVETTLLQMQKDIFMDLAWQHEAYLQGGIAEITARFSAGDIDQTTYGAWVDIDNGIHLGNQNLIWQGNTTLLKREQEIILAKGYDHLANIPGVAATMSKQVINAFDGGPFTGTDVSNFDQRWNWMVNQMVAPFRSWTQSQRDLRVAQDIRTLFYGE